MTSVEIEEDGILYLWKNRKERGKGRYGIMTYGTGRKNCGESQGTAGDE